MSQNVKPSNTHAWEHNYVAIYKCSPREKAANEIVIADRSKIAGNADLKRVLEALQKGMISKKEYPAAQKPTIRYAGFQKAEAKGNNNAQELLDALLAAKTDAGVRKSAAYLAKRYVEIKNVQKGVLIFLLSSLKSQTCIFIFKCDFEDISQLTPKQIFRRVEDAFEEQAKKAAQYPYYDGRKLDVKKVRVFDALGETQYWLKFLELAPPPTLADQAQSAFLSTLEGIRPGLIEDNREAFTSVPKERSLAIEDRLLATKDLVPHREVKKFAAALPDTKVSLSLGEARVTAPMKDYGQNWIVAAQDGTYYILIKGATLEVHSEGPGPLDVAHFVDLPQAAKELRMHF